MTLRIVSIVEGHGEQQALPTLLARIARETKPGVNLAIPEPIRVARDRFLNQPREFERTLSLARSKCGTDGRLLVLLDSEGECPKTIVPDLLARLEAACPQSGCALVLAHHEFEAWYLAAAASLSGQQGLNRDLQPPADPEAIRGCKEWLRRQMPPHRRYSETIDQPALAGKMDLAEARRAPSFDKLWRELERMLGGSPRG